MLAVMSNPGLELAILGNPHKRSLRGHFNLSRKGMGAKRIYQLAERWSKRKAVGKYRRYSVGVFNKAETPVHSTSHRWSGRLGSAGLFPKGRYTGAPLLTNPRSKGHTMARRYSRFAFKINPAVSGALKGYVGGITGLPGSLKSTFSGAPVKMATNAGVAIVSGVGSLVIGAKITALSRQYLPAMISGNSIVSRILPGLAIYTAGYIASKFVPVSADKKQAILVGAAAAAIAESVRPGTSVSLINMIPYAGPMLLKAAGLAGYVSAPGYQGVNGYVSAPSYQGVGYLRQAPRLAGYVSAPSYQAVRGLGNLGANIGSNMASFLDADFADAT